jgi:hypothetical protein
MPEIVIATQDGPMTMEATLIGEHLAVHEAPESIKWGCPMGYREWVVTHIGTGMAAAHGLSSKTDAIGLAKRLADLPGWDLVNAETNAVSSGNLAMKARVAPVLATFRRQNPMAHQDPCPGDLCSAYRPECFLEGDGEEGDGEKGDSDA